MCKTVVRSALPFVLFFLAWHTCHCNQKWKSLKAGWRDLKSKEVRELTPKAVYKLFLKNDFPPLVKFSNKHAG